MDGSLPVVCGVVSTAIFVVGTLPMLVKAAQTRDLSSYSLGNIVLSNVGNSVNTVYILSLPPGPVWVLHGFYVLTTGLMLLWYLRYSWRPTQKSPSRDRRELDSSPDAAAVELSLASSYHTGGAGLLVEDRLG
jgi:hypothetical protein